MVKHAPYFVPPSRDFLHPDFGGTAKYTPSQPVIDKDTDVTDVYFANIAKLYEQKKYKKSLISGAHWGDRSSYYVEHDVVVQEREFRDVGMDEDDPPMVIEQTATAHQDTDYRSSYRGDLVENRIRRARKQAKEQMGEREDRTSELEDYKDVDENDEEEVSDEVQTAVEQYIKNKAGKFYSGEKARDDWVAPSPGRIEGVVNGHVDKLKKIVLTARHLQKFKRENKLAVEAANTIKHKHEAGNTASGGGWSIVKALTHQLKANHNAVREANRIQAEVEIQEQRKLHTNAVPDSEEDNRNTEKSNGVKGARLGPPPDKDALQEKENLQAYSSAILQQKNSARQSKPPPKKMSTQNMNSTASPLARMSGNMNENASSARQREQSSYPPEQEESTSNSLRTQQRQPSQSIPPQSNLSYQTQEQQSPNSSSEQASYQQQISNQQSSQHGSQHAYERDSYGAQQQVRERSYQQQQSKNSLRQQQESLSQANNVQANNPINVYAEPGSEATNYVVDGIVDNSVHHSQNPGQAVFNIQEGGGVVSDEENQGSEKNRQQASQRPSINSKGGYAPPAGKGDAFSGVQRSQSTPTPNKQNKQVNNQVHASFPGFRDMRNESIPPSNQSIPPSNQSIRPSNQSIRPSNQSIRPSNQSIPPQNQAGYQDQVAKHGQSQNWQLQQQRESIPLKGPDEEERRMPGVLPTKKPLPHDDMDDARNSKQRMQVYQQLDDFLEAGRDLAEEFPEFVTKPSQMCEAEKKYQEKRLWEVEWAAMNKKQAQLAKNLQGEMLKAQREGDHKKQYQDEDNQLRHVLVPSEKTSKAELNRAFGDIEQKAMVGLTETQPGVLKVNVNGVDMYKSVAKVAPGTSSMKPDLNVSSRSINQSQVRSKKPHKMEMGSVGDLITVDPNAATTDEEAAEEGLGGTVKVKKNTQILSPSTAKHDQARIDPPLLPNEQLMADRAEWMAKHRFEYKKFVDGDMTYHLGMHINNLADLLREIVRYELQQVVYFADDVAQLIESNNQVWRQEVNQLKQHVTDAFGEYDNFHYLTLRKRFEMILVTYHKGTVEEVKMRLLNEMIAAEKNKQLSSIRNRIFGDHDDEEGRGSKGSKTSASGSSSMSSLEVLITEYAKAKQSSTSAQDLVPSPGGDSPATLRNHRFALKHKLKELIREEFGEDSDDDNLNEKSNNGGKIDGRLAHRGVLNHPHHLPSFAWFASQRQRV